ncbi:hypothetical protein FEM03_12470 [Phragmitibacter flavus]|uniref:DUF3828 domain-containing protein n=1 Tax=Phragmitibacter flavus TaxID=2576071 RepID=A0A5R8KE11_9BACT|nr:hypothetical protein [Phragmitibacter flavus]TLD70533.1 hypothetical protein FEM03_12470 [Phragmitibacter flavus]
MRLTLLLLLFGLSLSQPVRGNQGESEAVRVAEAFYIAYVKLGPRGLPSESAMKTFAPIFTDELTETIEQARRAQAAFIKKYPSDKPPWIEGNLFASLWEGVDSFSLGRPLVHDQFASIPVYLEWSLNGEKARWIDVIVLQRSEKAWRISDIFMNAPWSFRAGPSLRAILAPENAPNAEQPGAGQAGPGQPATRSQLESEGGEKPKPEAEGRSR